MALVIYTTGASTSSDAGCDLIDYLFSLAPDPKEVEARALSEIAANLERLLIQSRRRVKLVDHTLEIFGSFYGQVTEPVARQAVRLLHAQGKTPSNGIGVKRTRDITVTPGPGLA